ncbi:ribonuclease H [Ignatzschineria rhizosphaerae]|uniref:Ribonuclease H n=1 Tax=Ignatzschineria rhizosphaerae TaxID=2923279 RepID=A0ABY3X8R8_9GAMM|nr:DUF4440 domain-containing protein [Ignatzschineria rhizosphaerae]UNM97111.1 ribonuclease H [Ignatzschineria rhizosphaerae]
MQELFRQIIHLEKKLHHPEHRQNRLFLTATLHDDFLEFGRSGFTTNKAQTLQDLLGVEPNSVSMIHSENYVSVLLKPGVILVTYQSYQLKNQERIKLTNRSSVWVETRSTDWQLRFHQGTPVAID